MDSARNETLATTAGQGPPCPGGSPALFRGPFALRHPSILFAQGRQERKTRPGVKSGKAGIRGSIDDAC